MKTAVLIDGGFFIKRLRKLSPELCTTAKDMAKAAHDYALRVLELQNDKNERKRELYRIFFYDCPPLTKKIRNPITQKEEDLSQSPTALFRNELHDILRGKRKVALRLGKIADYGAWQIKPRILNKLLRGEIAVSSLTEQDVAYQMTQKGVDMKLGLDISSLAHGGQVDQIILIAGDSDFVPAAKLARRSGIDFILDPMWGNINADLREHIDGVISAGKKL